MFKLNIQGLTYYENRKSIYKGKLKRSVALRMMDIWENKILTAKQYRNGQGLPNSSNINCNIISAGIMYIDRTVFIANHDKFLNELKNCKMVRLTQDSRAKARQRAKDFKNIKSHIN